MFTNGRPSFEGSGERLVDGVFSTFRVPRGYQNCAVDRVEGAAIERFEALGRSQVGQLLPAHAPGHATELGCCHDNAPARGCVYTILTTRETSCGPTGIRPRPSASCMRG